MLEEFRSRGNGRLTQKCMDERRGRRGITFAGQPEKMRPGVPGRNHGESKTRGEQESPSRPQILLRGLIGRMLFLIG